MFITGPEVIKTVTGEEVGFEELGGAMSHATKSGVAHFAADDEDACLEDARYLFSFLPSNNLETAPRVQPTDDPDRDGRGARLDRPRQPQQALRHPRRRALRRRRRRVPRGPRALRAEHRRRLQPPQRLRDRRRRQPAEGDGRRARHRRVRQGRPLRALLRRVQHPDPDARRRPGLPARHRPGVGRDHPPRREAALRLRRGDRAEDHRDHAQGLRRRLRRHVLQAPDVGLQLRLADGRDRGDGARGRGQHHPPPRHRRLTDAGRAPREADRRLQGALRQPVHRGRARLRGRRDHPPRDAPEADRRARGPAHQARARARGASTGTSRSSATRPRKVGE